LDETNEHQSPCEVHEPALYLEILAALLAGLIGAWGGWLWAGGHRIWGGIVAVLSLWLYLSFATSAAFGDPLFWRVGGRLLHGQEPYRWDHANYPQTEYRQSLQHDAENVAQISVLETSVSESIPEMKNLRENIGEGLRHLTWSFIWKFLGAEALITAAATGAAVGARHLIHIAAGSYSLPLSFYLVIALLIFCAMTLFAILVLMLHNSVNSAPTTQPQQLPPSPSKLSIRGAFYRNSPENEVSVLPRLNSFPKDAFAILVTNNNMDVDPAPSIGPKKRLRVRYSYGNETVFETSREEGEWLVLPDPTDRKRQIR
jgi:hypothetical protein